MNELDFMIWELGCLIVEIEEFEFDSPRDFRGISLNRNMKRFKNLCSKKENKLKEIIEYKKTNSK